MESQQRALVALFDEENADDEAEQHRLPGDQYVGEDEPIVWLELDPLGHQIPHVGNQPVQAETGER